MCIRNMALRPSKEDRILQARNKGDMLDFDIKVEHDLDNCSQKERDKIASNRLQLTQQDPEALMSYEVFV